MGNAARKARKRDGIPFERTVREETPFISSLGYLRQSTSKIRRDLQARGWEEGAINALLLQRTVKLGRR